MTNNVEPSKVLTAVRELVPELIARATEIDQARGLPPELNEKLRAAGVFRMLIPRYYGGEELHPLQVSRVLEELSRADASTGWTGMVGVGFNITLGHFSRELTDKLFADSPDVLVRGAIAPKGVAIPAPGGYIVQGCWQLGSGSYDYQWVLANCIVLRDGAPTIGPNGMPEMRAALLPKDKAQFLDTWDAVGLRGTASNDFIVKEQLVPELYAANLFGPATFDMPVHRLPFMMIAAPTHGSVAVGIAQGALDDVATLAKTKRPAFAGGKRLAEDPLFTYRYGELVVRLAGLRGLLEKRIMDNGELANSELPITPLDIAGTSAVAAYVQVNAVDIVNEAFALAGSNACCNSSPLQRRWRDIRCVAQHQAANTNSYQLFGSLLVGGDSSQAA